MAEVHACDIVLLQGRRKHQAPSPSGIRVAPACLNAPTDSRGRADIAVKMVTSPTVKPAVVTVTLEKMLSRAAMFVAARVVLLNRLTVGRRRNKVSA